MLNIINDSVRFTEELTGGRTITKIYNTYPFITESATIALQGFDYGFSDEEGMFFRCTIETKCEIISLYKIKVSVTFGFRSREFDKRTDAKVDYSLLLNQRCEM